MKCVPIQDLDPAPNVHIKSRFSLALENNIRTFKLKEKLLTTNYHHID